MSSVSASTNYRVLLTCKNLVILLDLNDGGGAWFSRRVHGLAAAWVPQQVDS